ncbi:alpha/beta fold hydrolase [Virgibacillus kimchii]
MNRTLGEFYTGDVTIEYSIAGEGDPAFVFHGGHSNCNETFGYEALLQNGFSVITPSRPGYGGTSKEIGKSLATASEYYNKLLNHLNISQVHVLAISAGGASGIYFASKYPNRVRSLTLQSAVTKEWLSPKDKEYKAAQLLFHPRMEKYTWAFISWINNLFPRFIFRQMFPSFSTLSYKEAQYKFSEHDTEEIKKMNNRQRSGDGFLIDLKQIDEVSDKDLQAVSCPTLIMHSINDASVSVEHAYFAHENISHSKLNLLDTWGHLIWLGKDADETNDRVVRFLNKY